MAAPRSLLLLALVAIMLCGAFAERHLLSRNEGRKSRAAKRAEKACKRANPGCDDCVDDGTGTLTYYCACCDTGYVYDLAAESVCTCDAESGFASLTKTQWRAFARAGVVPRNPPRKTVVVPRSDTSGTCPDEDHDDDDEHVELGRCTLCSAFGNFEVDPEGSGNCVPVAAP